MGLGPAIYDTVAVPLHNAVVLLCDQLGYELLTA